MTKTADLLTPPGNYATVQLPDRHFPGVVFQGDSLHILLSPIKKISASLHKDTKKADEMLSEIYKRS